MQAESEVVSVPARSLQLVVLAPRLAQGPQLAVDAPRPAKKLQCRDPGAVPKWQPWSFPLEVVIVPAGMTRAQAESEVEIVPARSPRLAADALRSAQKLHWAVDASMQAREPQVAANSSRSARKLQCRDPGVVSKRQPWVPSLEVVTVPARMTRLQAEPEIAVVPAEPLLTAQTQVSSCQPS